MSSWFISAVVGAVIGFLLGRQSGLNNQFYLEQLEELNKHYRKMEEPLAEEEASGVTAGVYKHVDEVSAETRDKDRRVGVVKPKSPKTLEREALERMTVASEKWGLAEKDGE